MNRLMKISVLTLTLAGGYMAATSAFAGSTDAAGSEGMVTRLTEKLGLDVETAEEVASTLLAAREQKRSLRQSVKSEAQTLKAALDGGDERGMRQSMEALKATRDELVALKRETAERVDARLTIEQRAKRTLHHMGRERRQMKSRPSERRDRRAN